MLAGSAKPSLPVKDPLPSVALTPRPIASLSTPAATRSGERARSKRRTAWRVAPRHRGKVHVNQYYFYILDRNVGLTFIKFSSYAPFPVRVWLNGHEWGKRQLDRKRIRYQALDNGFLSCADPEALQNVPLSRHRRCRRLLSPLAQVPAAPLLRQ